MDLSRVIVGIDERSDIDTLLDDGIRQFYFGFVDADFLREYGSQISPNRRYRQKEQFSSLQKAYEAIKKIKSANSQVYLALNSFGANAKMLEFSKKIYIDFKDRVDGIITANLSVTLMLKDDGYKDIVTSNLFGTYTKEAVGFLIDRFSPKKIILPRDISLLDIKEIVTTFKEQKFEVFLYGDNCRYSEAFCFVEHGYDSIGFGSLCSYAFLNKRLIKASSPTYKDIVLDSTLSPKEKKEKLKRVSLDFDDLLDALEMAEFEKDAKSIHKIVEILNIFDESVITKNQKSFIRALNITKDSHFPTVKEFYKKLLSLKVSSDDSYKIFHKLNTEAIKKSIEFFEKFENIVSYKIPSRGRGHFEYLLQEPKESYNYKESQYLL